MESIRMTDCFSTHLELTENLTVNRLHERTLSFCCKLLRRNNVSVIIVIVIDLCPERRTVNHDRFNKTYAKE